MKTRFESAPGVCNQRLKLKCDEPLSDFPFNVNVRRYSKARLMEMTPANYIGNATAQANDILARIKAIQ